jgi:cytochrome P450
MDDPRHFRLRNIVAKGFTPKQITQVEGYVRTKATAIIDRLLEQFPAGECDFVEQVAAPLPLQIICEMMGIPVEDEAQIFGWTNVILGVGDPEYVGSFEQLMGVLMSMFMYAQQLGEDRRQPWRRHRSVLMHAEVDGERLTPQDSDRSSSCSSSPATRPPQRIAHGMKLLTDNPINGQVVQDYDGT